MGTKKEILKKFVPNFTIDDPINTDEWKCVVVMAVERQFRDSFVLKYFAEEAVTGRRQNVKVINFDLYVLKILNDFVNGELPFKRAFLLNFSSVLQEAAEFVSKKAEIPIPLLAKVVKALLLFFREESYSNIEKKAMGPVDPIKEMSNRPSEVPDSKLKSTEKLDKDKFKKTSKDLEVKVRPPSTTKLESHLLKRGEGVKDDQCINDAPIDGYFNLYVLLTGFYSPDLPLELIKANIPLHGVLCIDTSKSNVRRISSTLTRFRKVNSIINEAQFFWDKFLKILWNPFTGPYFQDTIFQVYVPQKLSCDELKLREFIFREISFLMYDMSDYKRQLNNYLKHIRVRDVTEQKRADLMVKYDLLEERKPTECTSVPSILENIIFAVSGKNINSSFASSTASYNSIGSLTTMKSSDDIMYHSQSVVAKRGSNAKSPPWSQIVFESGSPAEMKVYSKIRELDVKYVMDDQFVFEEQQEDKKPAIKECSFESCSKNRIWSANIEDAMKIEESMFNFYWKNFIKVSKLNEYFTVEMDSCLYPILTTRVFCPVENAVRPNCQAKRFPLKKHSYFELIDNLTSEMRKPHFTVTQGTRSVLHSMPFNLKDKSQDFFHPPQLKIVTPEMLKTSSAPEFRDPPNLMTETSFISALNNTKELMNNISFHVFKNLEKFLGEDIFKTVNNFEFLEELSKPKLIERENQLWNEYNCIDYNYSILMDTVFFVFHNRKCDNDIRHETFNEVLKSNVGLRDFFEYVLEDESDWLESEEASYKLEQKSITGQLMQSKPPIKFANSDFWMVDSIKYQEDLKMKVSKDDKDREEDKTKGSSHRESLKVKKKVSIVDKNINSRATKEIEEPESVVDEPEDFHYFEAYDLTGSVAQFSGLKTTYYSKNCSVAVDLLERLYGNQDLGIHVNFAGHILHLYSFACPTPHVLDPYTCHVCYKNGIIMAFSKRTHVPPTQEFQPSNKNTGKTFFTEPSSAEGSNGDFFYDMQLSLPNGLILSVVRKIVRPCYIKQKYLPQSKTVSGIAINESSRLFLTNGNVIKMLKDGSVEILKPDTSIINAYLGDLTEESSQFESHLQNGKLSFRTYLFTALGGYMQCIDHRKIVYSKKIQLLQNSDLKSNTTYFRRKDGTNYMLNSHGTIVVQFVDGTKISSSCFVNENEEIFSSNVSSEEIASEGDTGFLVVHMEFIIEHRDYVTVKYNTETENWSLMLPFKSDVTITSDGCYYVKIDSNTDLAVNPDVITMNRYKTEGEVQCSMIANLNVFDEDQQEKIYIQMIDSKGKTFVVESNSNCYVAEDGERETSEIDSIAKEKSPASSSSTSRTSNLCDSHGIRLVKKNKYFAVRKDVTGFEIIHREDARKILTKIPEDSVVFTLKNPCAEDLSIFVLISPANVQKSKRQMWETKTIIPDPKFLSSLTTAKTSSLYGNPPCWFHPYPKRKKKFKIPDRLSCRIFIETIKSDVVPMLSAINCSYCEMEDDVKEKFSKLDPDPEKFKLYMKKISEEDQTLLKEMYALKAKESFQMKMNQKPVNPEKLEKYLKKSKHCVELQNYHKHAIRYHTVPNFFQHPAGMAWLLLNEQIENCTLFSESDHRKGSSYKYMPQLHSTTALKNQPHLPASAAISKSASRYSYEEVECNLNPVRGHSFSDLSCRSDVSAKTAPPVISKGGVCSCKIKAARATQSSPMTYNIVKDNPLQGPSETELIELTEYEGCGFQKGDFELLQKMKYQETEKGTMTLDDLMSLGLV